MRRSKWSGPIPSAPSNSSVYCTVVIGVLRVDARGTDCAPPSPCRGPGSQSVRVPRPPHCDRRAARPAASRGSRAGRPGSTPAWRVWRPGAVYFEVEAQQDAASAAFHRGLGRLHRDVHLSGERGRHEDRAPCEHVARRPHPVGSCRDGGLNPPATKARGMPPAWIRPNSQYGQSIRERASRRAPARSGA